MVSKKAVAAGIAAAVLIGVISLVIYPFYFTSLGALLVPVFVLMYFRCGAFVSAFAVAVLAFVGYLTGGAVGAALPIMAYGPIVYIITYMLGKKQPVRNAVFYGCTAMLVSLLAYFGTLLLLTQGLLFEQISASLRANYEFAYNELIGIQKEMPASAALLFIRPEEFPEEELILAMKTLFLPQMAKISAIGALLGAAIPIVRQRKRGLAETVSALSPLHTWHVPRKLGLTLIASYFGLAFLSLTGLSGAMVAANSVWQIVTVVYGASCLAFASAYMRKQAYERSTRNLLLFLCAIGIWLVNFSGMLGGIPVIIGVMGESSQLRTARVIGDADGPFGPPDRREEDRQKDDKTNN